ncbi:DNA gyrase inhibitor YacG [Methylobacterium sp. BE186]|uniref:DNA gyrase inhibitor YacG n=1 Tax=Methylobacterium sp. BE186 TaxID=2817715 RepID=UPI00286C6341|nr:DNA gyrase inhibitor YacG [Methylobacterium sp. BE186]
MERAGVKESSREACRCPICGRPSMTVYKPFCSEQCADIDLGHWLSDRYVMPGYADEDDDRSQQRTE